MRCSRLPEHKYTVWIGCKKGPNEEYRFSDVPSVEFERDFKVVQIGNNVTLKCPISVANPRNLQRTWYKGDERIEKYTWERYSLDKKSLQIKGVTYDDTGIFICKGTNGFGSNEVRIDLFVLGK